MREEERELRRQIRELGGTEKPSHTVEYRLVEFPSMEQAREFRLFLVVSGYTAYARVNVGTVGIYFRSEGDKEKE